MDLSLLTQIPLANSVPTLAATWNPFVTNLLVGVFLLISGGMILLVLIQRPQGGGLSGAFGAGGGGGGGGAGQTAFGTKTGDVLTGATITIFILFLVTAIVLNFATRPQQAQSSVPAITAPIEDAQDEVGDEAGDSEIADPEQAIEDIMESEPSIESDPPAETEEAPASTIENGTEEPAADDS